MVQVPTWKHLCSLTDDLTSIESMEHLERLLQQHFNLSENISRIYAQVIVNRNEKEMIELMMIRSVMMEKPSLIQLPHLNRQQRNINSIFVLEQNISWKLFKK